MADEKVTKVSGRPGGGAFPGGEPDYMRALSRGREFGPVDDSADRAEMRKNRRVNARTSSSGGNSRGTDVSFATTRRNDPMFYWKANNLPYDVTKDEELRKIRAWCRLLYLTHPVIASAIDIFTKYPLTGMELQCRDPALTDFYTTLFFDQLDYEEFLIDLGREYWMCALPGERISTSSGMKLVEDVMAGDEVLTHQGRLRSVLDISEKVLETTAYTIQPHYSLPLHFTEGHEFLVLRDGVERWMPVEQIVLSDSVLVPVDFTVRSKQNLSAWEVIDRADWQVHGPLVVDEGQTIRRRKYERAKYQKLISLGVQEGDIIRRKTDHGGMWSMLTSPSWALDDDFMRLCGLYVAEGSSGRDGAQWSYGWHESDLAKETVGLIERIFGVTARVEYRTSSCVVIVGNQPLAALFGGLFGYGAKTKSIPEWVLWLDLGQQAAFLSGWLDGDGHVAHQDGSQGRRVAKIATSSSQLAHQAETLIRRLGFVSTITKAISVRNDTSCRWWNVGVAMTNTKEFLSRLGWSKARIASIGGISDSEPRVAKVDPRGYWTKIHKVSFEEYCGPVYDLSVQEDHSFVASGVAVHNCGEAWPLGSFNETLGVWDQEELINPDDVDVHRSPFVPEPRFEMRLPESIRKVLTDRSPRWEYEALMATYPELANFVGEQARMPVSNVLLKQLKFKGDTFHPRGLPILMRAFRSIQQEEMLNAAQDAIADRLYTPLVLAKLGASATDLGTSSPWIPTEADLGDFEEALDAALAADFRVLTHHFAIEMSTVFGRENMPNLDADFDRLTEKILQVFGLSKTMLSGADGGQTYAADALNRDLISQLLTSYQRKIVKHYKERALVVAEAQEHWDYEERGGKRYPIMEEILERDPKTGEDRIVEQPKLLVPDLKIKAMSMSNEQDLRQFYEALRVSGVPISQRTRLVNVPIDLDEEIEKTSEEQVEQAVKAQEVRKETYIKLRAKNLPIPQDLLDDFEPKAVQAQGDEATAPEVIPTVGLVEPAPTDALAPTPEDQAAAVAADEPAPQPGQSPLQVLPRNQIAQPGRTRPPESDEMRAGMPRAATIEIEVDGETREVESVLFSGPRHIGMRRFSRVTSETSIDNGREEVPA